MQFLTLQNNRTKFTRMCIGEAIVSLMDSVDFSHLSITSIVKRAGVSRITFYKYYPTPKKALEDYLHIIISEYIEESQKYPADIEFLSYEHILYSLNFFDRYRDFFLTMKAKGLYSILIDSVNEFVVNHIQSDTKISIYKQYSYAGSLLNSFLMWEENGKKESAEDVAMTIYELYGKSQHYQFV